MQRLKAMFNDDSAVSPVIGVILMVAITVILAAVIASFVLGLGDQGEPAPSPTMETSVDANEVSLDVTGGDDFDASVATIDYTLNGTTYSADLDGGSASEITAGDTITMNTAGTGNEIQLNGNGLGGDALPDNSDPSASGATWEVQIIWNPSDQDSTVIYSDSSS
ncbi:type IV pilin N-terminal domain-containing protein [Halovenus sp. HT40]|uniref:type IV pilin N-terminal domain-containing protein n=1 Tax=Halovenus sp. HT40 TaxID=3126691 RepID=UPI00300F101E